MTPKGRTGGHGSRESADIYNWGENAQRDDIDFPSLPIQPFPYEYRKLIKQAAEHKGPEVLAQGVKNSPLFWLPVEIRIKIWELVLVHYDRKVPGYDSKVAIYVRDSARSRNWIDEDSRMKSPLQPNFLPKICFASRLMREEISHLFLRNNQFVIRHLEEEKYFKIFVNSLCNGLQSVRSLHLDYFDIYTDDSGDKESWLGGEMVDRVSALDLAIKCDNLQVLHVGLHARNGYTYEDRKRVCRLQTAEQFIKKYRLQRLLKCKNLRKVYFSQDYRQVCEKRVVDDTMYWTEDKFKAARPKRDVEISGWPYWWPPYGSIRNN